MDENDHFQSMQRVLALFNANKLSKSNVWNVDLINSFDFLVKKHHEYVRNFQNVCPALDASAKIYEMRVDSVYTDFIRFSSSTYLRGTKCITVFEVMKAMAPEHLLFPIFFLDPIHRSMDAISEKNFTANDTTIYESDRSIAPKKKTKKRKFRSNIASKNQINGPLTVLQNTTDPIISKMNSIDGEIGKSERLLLNFLPTNNQSKLSLCVDNLFFDRTEHDKIELKSGDCYDLRKDEFSELSVKLKCDVNLQLRQQLCGFQLLEEPNENDDDANDTDLNFNFDEADSFIFEFEDIPQTQEPISQLPPINTGDTSIGIESFVENDVESFAGNDNEQSNENDVEHFPPVSDLCTGEYSYFKNIQNFYAGPTYWKYMRKRTINQSIGKAPIKRRRKEPEVPDFECYASDSSDESDEDSLFQSVDKIRKSIRTVGYRNWDSQKLLLPPPLKIPNNLFDRYTFAPSIKTDKTLSPDESFDDVANTSDELFDDDFCVMNDANDLDDIRYCATSSPNTNEVFDLDLPIEPAIPFEQSTISHEFCEAPKLVENVMINYEKLPKIVNMAKFNKTSMESIQKQFNKSSTMSWIISQENPRSNENYKPGIAMYSNTYKSLFKRYPHTVSPSLVLLTILHNANKERLRLDRAPNLNNDFKIHDLE